MSVTQLIKRLTSPDISVAGLTDREAGTLLSTMLDGGVDELELGAMLALLEHKPVTGAELLGYGTALAQRCRVLRSPPGRARPAVFACYQGVRGQAHLLPLVALTLQRLGVPVLVHGALDGAGGNAAAYVFRELGVLPSGSLAHAQARMEEHRLAFLPTAGLAPGLAELLALKGRLGFGGFMRAMARLLVPFEGAMLHVAATNDFTGNELLRAHLAANGSRALLLEGVEGEPFADPLRRPRIEYAADGEWRILFEAEAATARHPVPLPPSFDAHTVAAWTRAALSGEVPVPLPLVNQIACCLYGAGYTDDINQAKAIVAIETGSLAAA